jgi:hypothetical protein
MIQAFSRPLPHDAEHGTDEIQALSPFDVEMLRRFTAPPVPKAPPSDLGRRLREARDELDDMMGARTARYPVPTGPIASYGPQVAVQAPAYPVVTAPLSVTRLVMHSFHIAIKPGYLPPNVLVCVDTRIRRLWLAPSLAPLHGEHEAAAGWGAYADRLERVIESRPVTRYVLAAMWVRYGSSSALGAAPPTRCAVAAFAPASGLIAQAWGRSHADYYTRLWKQTNTLVAPREAIEKLTAVYLGEPEMPAYGIPRLGAEREQAVTERALRVLPALRGEALTPTEFRTVAWTHYVDWLARCLAVPRLVIHDRLAGDMLATRTPDELCAWTDRMLRSSTELGEWRARTAQAFGLMSETTRAGDYRTPAQRVALWLAEPSAAVRYQAAD